METKKYLRYFVGGCFVIGAGLIALSIRQNGFYAWHIFCIIAEILTAIGLFVEKPIISAVGSGVYAATAAFRAFRFVKVAVHVYQDGGHLGHLLGWGDIAFDTCMYLLFWILLIIAFADKKNAKIFALVAAVVLLIDVISIVFGIGGYKFFGSRIKDYSRFLHHGAYRGLFSDILLIVQTLLLSFSFKTERKTVQAVSSSANYSSESAAERLEKLKKLLDCGMITQEDFEQKKKQILEL